MGDDPWLPPRIKIVFLFGFRFNFFNATDLSILIKSDLIGFPVITHLFLFSFLLAIVYAKKFYQLYYEVF